MSNLVATPTWTYQNITTAATTTVKSGFGNLHSIVINIPTANAITIYDNTSASGTKIGTITPTATAGWGTYEYDVDFGTGLTIVTAGTPDITVCYR
jgi:hypothetical protein